MYRRYAYSLVFAADMYATIFKKAPLDPKLGKLYREKILLPGGSKDEMDLLKVCQIPMHGHQVQSALIVPGFSLVWDRTFWGVNRTPRRSSMKLRRPDDLRDDLKDFGCMYDSCVCWERLRLLLPATAC